MFNLEKFNQAEFEENVLLEVYFTPSRDDGYGSFARQRETHIVGKNLDDKEIPVKVRDAVNKVLQSEDVKSGEQKPIFELRAVNEKVAKLNLLSGLTLEMWVIFAL